MSTSSLKHQLLQSFQTGKEYRHAFVEESIRSGLAGQIRTIREVRKMDPKNFAKHLGKKVSWIYRLEDPNAPAPTISSLLEVAKAFDIDLEVRFRPFSKRLDDLGSLSETSFDVPSFDEELLAGAFNESNALGAISYTYQPGTGWATMLKGYQFQAGMPHVPCSEITVPGGLPLPSNLEVPYGNRMIDQQSPPPTEKTKRPPVDLGRWKRSNKCPRKRANKLLKLRPTG